MKDINWTTLIGGLIAAGKLVSNSFGIDLPDELINDLVNGVAAVVAIVAIFSSHKLKKGGGEVESTKHTGDSGPAV